MEPDIVQKIMYDYKHNYAQVFNFLNEFKLRSNCSARIIRCILYLSKADIGALKAYIMAAEKDWRDIVLEAEAFNFEYNIPFNLR